MRKPLVARRALHLEFDEADDEAVGEVEEAQRDIVGRHAHAEGEPTKKARRIALDRGMLWEVAYLSQLKFSSAIFSDCFTHVQGWPAECNHLLYVLAIDADLRVPTWLPTSDRWIRLPQLRQF